MFNKGHYDKEDAIPNKEIQGSRHTKVHVNIEIHVHCKSNWFCDILTGSDLVSLDIFIFHNTCFLFNVLSA